MHLNLSYKLFERHFFDNGFVLVKILWQTELTKLKGFVDSLFNELIVKPVKNSNVFIASHFSNNGEPISSRNLGNAISKKEYIEIYHDKEDVHPIVQLINEIKASIS